MITFEVYIYMAKTTISVTVDYEAKDAVLRRGLSPSKLCNDALWKAVKPAQFNEEEMQDAQASITEVLNRAAESGKVEKINRDRLYLLMEEVKPFLSLDGEKYREVLEKTKEKYTKRNTTEEKIVFWEKVLDNLKKVLPAPTPKKVVE